MVNPSLQSFLDYALHRRLSSAMWVTEYDMDLYVRYGKVLINGQPTTVLTLANMVSHNPGSGNLRRLLGQLESEHNLYVESVVNPRLCNFFAARSYTLANKHLITPNFYHAKTDSSCNPTGDS